jgi:hypothetical protein
MVMAKIEAACEKVDEFMAKYPKYTMYGTLFRFVS